jgi:hypothetical protein
VGTNSRASSAASPAAEEELLPDSEQPESPSSLLEDGDSELENGDSDEEPSSPDASPSVQRM